MNSLALLMHEYRSRKHHVGLGRFFVERYVFRPFPALLYEDDDNEKAGLMIQEWLIENRYQDHLPEPLRRQKSQ